MNSVYYIQGPSSFKSIKCIIAGFMFLVCITCSGQFWDGCSGLLQAPSADMHKEGTFTITNNILNKHSISPWYWGYNTFSYGIGINLWSRLEIGYVCVLLNGSKNPTQQSSPYYSVMRNQDRHFNAKVLLLKEGEFGVSWLPAIAIGVSDPTSYNGNDYTDQAVAGEGNGFFNRYYAVATKHFCTRIGTVGAHVGYQYNRRTDFPMNGPCVALDWIPLWLDNPNFKLKAIAEYDSRTFNVGFIASIWRGHFDVMFELMAMKWINFGVRYKLQLKS